MRPGDPLFRQQWHFALIGDIRTIWNDHDGTDVTIGVYDTGVDYRHSDLDANVDMGLSVVGPTGDPIDPFPDTNLFQYASHGTSVAGIIAAEANNGRGGVGVAHGATLGAVNIFAEDRYGFVNGQQSAFLDVVSQAARFDIMSNSWGSYPYYHNRPFDRQSEEAYVDACAALSRDGRDQLGTIIVQAAGNNDLDGNGEFKTGSRFTISVAATDSDGHAASYSNFGACILVSAPAASVTTDISGGDGYSSGSYTKEFGGTSASTPVVSGVIALMLDANPLLGWRDVQNILAASATLTGSAFTASAPGLEEEETWQSNGGSTWNGGGQHIHANYGYGMVNAFAAVRMAEVWHLFGTAQTSVNEEMRTGRKDLGDIRVPNLDPDGITRSVTVKGRIDIEHVQLILDVESDQMKDLRILLTSPDGTTVTVAFDDLVPDNRWDDLDGKWTFGIDGLRGESSNGVWKIQVMDLRGKNKDTRLEGVEIKVFGKTASVDDVYHFTNEFRRMEAVEARRGVIKDTNGGQDWLNFAAVTANLRIDLGDRTFGSSKDSWGRLDGRFEHIVTGDGDDILTGNRAGGEFHGKRGHDILRGVEGNDRLFGGAGRDNLQGGSGKDWLEGGSGEDLLRGGTGSDRLDGGSGRDVLEGGAGSDVYRFSTGDRIVEARSSGTDTIFSNVSVRLPVNVEKVVLEGKASVDAFGGVASDILVGNEAANALHGGGGADQLFGRNGDDRLSGQDGNDVLSGGTGRDTLIGGAGADVFLFASAPAISGVDLIGDFRSGIDRIHLDAEHFPGISVGVLTGEAFAANSTGTATDASDRIILETLTGDLWYDRDGTGVAERVRFARLDPAAGATVSDFIVI